ncbi:TIGR01841 family phasin [Thiomonas sp. FB-Cd]|uniref:TIGR01841 family phasin n=1 Tax=Thiomonas sp. FB-Cd TaxID=1158292 RepID=UPI0004DF0C32|nr:TIGR01841 family phasin [Thiomonas sp. FB-Cd]
MMTPEQMIAAQKSQLEAIFALSGKAVEGLEKMVELNMQTLKTAMHETSDATMAALSVKDIQELTALQPNLAQPMAEKLLSYSHHLYEIASGTQAEFAKAIEANVAEAHKKMQSVVDTAVKNAPAGSETAVAMMKSALSAANNAYDTVQKASKQAAEVVEANFNTVTNTAMKAAQSTTRGKRAAA